MQTRLCVTAGPYVFAVLAPAATGLYTKAWEWIRKIQQNPVTIQKLSAWNRSLLDDNQV